MRIEELASEFAVQLEEELAGLYSPVQIQTMRQPYEKRILALLRDAYGDEDISDIQALRELWQHLIDIDTALGRKPTQA